MAGELVQDITENLMGSRDAIEEIKDNVTVWEDKSEELSKEAKTYNERLDQVNGSITEMVDQLPLLTENMKEALVDNLTDFAEPVVGQFSSIADRGLQAFRSIGAAGQIAIAGVLALLATGVMFFKQWNEEIQSFITDIGASRQQLKGMTTAARSTWENLAMYGVAMDTALESGKALIDEFGTIDNQVAGLISTTAMVSKGFGMSADNAAKLVRLQTQSLNLSKSQLDSNLKLIKSISNQMDVGPGAVARNIAEASEDVAKFSRNGMENIIKAAAYAERLGVNLSDVTNIAENLMDIEQSTQAALKAQFYFGAQVNTSLARQQALQGDLTGMMDTMLGQLSKSADLQNMNYMQRQALADMLGVSVDKAMQMVKQYETTRQLAEDLNMSTSEMGDLAESLNLAGMQSKLSSIANLFKYSILPMLEPILFVFDKILWGIEWILKGMTWLNKKTSKWAGYLAGAAISIGLISSSGGLLGSLFGKIGGAFKGAKNLMGKGLGGMFGGGGAGGGFINFINRLNVKKLLGAATAMGIIAGSIWILSEAMQNFSQGVSWQGVAMGITSMLALTGAVAVLGAIMMSGVGTVAILAGAAAMAVMGGSLWIVSKAMQGFAQAGQIAIPLFESLGQLNGQQLMSVATGITSLGIALTGFAVGSIASGISTLLSGNLFKNFFTLAEQSGKFKTIATSLQQITGISGNLQFEKMAEDIGLLINPLTKVAEKANKAKLEMRGLAGATTATTIAESIGGLVRTVTGGDEERTKNNFKIESSDVVLDGKKVGEVIFKIMRGD